MDENDSTGAAAAPAPESAEERLERITREYAAGAYKVDPEAVAAKIIDDATEL